MPRRDVLGRVHVSVERATAGHTDKEGLALATLCCDVPARATTLARERGIDLLHPARRLVLQSAHQQPPAGPHDLPVEPGFLPHAPARFGDGAPSRASHVLDAYVFNTDHVEAAREIGGGLLGPVLAQVRIVCFQPGDGQLYPGATIRPTHGSGQSALKATESALPTQAEARNVQQLACGQRRTRGHTSIDADHLTHARCWDGVGDHGEGDMPVARAVERYPVGLRGRGYGARPAEAHPADLRYPDFAGLAAEPTDMPGLQGDNPEALITPGFPPRRAAVGAREEIRHRLCEVPQRLLLNHVVADPQPLILSTGLGELAALLQIARRSAAPWTPPGLLLDREVPYEAGMGAMVPQHRFLSSGRCQAVTGHSNIISTTDDIPGR